jgi:hypothetical protein
MNTQKNMYFSVGLGELTEKIPFAQIKNNISV